ncbi:MAG: hypothetical protein U0941_16595 [Planctomycetaceae bacterium]
MRLTCLICVTLLAGCVSNEVRERNQLKESVGFLIEKQSRHDLDPQTAKWVIEQQDGDLSTEKWSFRDRKTGDWIDYRVQIRRRGNGEFSLSGFDELEKASPELRQVSDER